VVDVQRKHLDADAARDTPGAVQQRCRIATAADGDRDALQTPVHIAQRSLVSVKRPYSRSRE